jgi:aspartate aminotransferase
MAAEFDRRRRLMVAGLNRLPGISCVMPRGAFYAFANVARLFGRRPAPSARPLASSTDVAEFLLDAAAVAVVPGAEFGADTHIRLSYATSLGLIEEGLRRMDRALRTLVA